VPAESEVRIRGMRELNRAFEHAGREARKELRETFRDVAQPVRRDAEQLAEAKIRNIGAKWPQMRVGVTRTSVYVAPKQRGVKTRGASSRRRPNLAPLMMERSLEPALLRNEATIEHATEVALDRIADTFNGRKL
jgi:hypothetical protein